LDIEQKIKRLRNLPQYKDLTEPELRAKLEAKAKTPSKKAGVSTEVVNDDPLQVVEFFQDSAEIALAKELQAKYLADYDLETISDKQLLRQLIYLEVFHITRLQKSANDFHATNGVIPIQLVDSLHKNINQIVTLKDKLGLTKDKEEELLQSDSYKALELLKKKFKVWRENNQASRTIICPHCGKMVMLKIRTEAWEAQQHPFFKDRLLGNSHLIALYKDKKITKEDVGKILEVSPDYCDWLLNKWPL